MILLWVAFTLGLTGSLHCMGMCGPLIIGSCNRFTEKQNLLFLHILEYNVGRILMYMFLGLIIGLFSQIIILGGLQKMISISSGIILIFIALKTSNIDSLLSNNWITKKISKFTFALNAKLYKNFKKPRIIFLGLLNGLLPCGLVYLALAGALSSGNLYSGSMFMLCFGIGTLPLLVTTAYFGKSLRNKFPLLYQKILPMMTGLLGLMMIIRGVIINMPVSINFLEALANPILCH